MSKQQHFQQKASPDGLKGSQWQLEDSDPMDQISPTCKKHRECSQKHQMH